MSNYLGSQRVALMQPRLPYEYQEVEYIESTGTQYIDTGHISNDNTNVEFKAMVVSDLVQGWSIIFGSRVGSRNQEFAMSTYSDDGKYTGGFRFGSYSYNPSISIGETLVISKKGLTFCNHTDNVQFNIATAVFNTQYPMYIFALNNAGDVSQKGAVRMWYFKIWQGSTLVRDFVPCYRKSDGLGGLFDLVEMKFYENKGSSDFVKGADNTQIKLFEKIMDTEFDEPDEPDTLLPKEYQQVEYVESEAHQVIDTQVVAKSGISIEARVMWREISPDSALLGARHSGNRIYLLYQYPLGTWNIGYGGNHQAGSIEQDVIYDIGVTLRNGTQKFVVNGETQWTNTIAQDYDLGINLYLFNYNESGMLPGYYSKARVYSLKMYVNDVLVRDFIPCYKKSDGEVGLFDLVTQAFYKNLGSVALLKGGDVN